MDCCLFGIKGCAKLIVAPIRIPYKLCCGSKTSNNTVPQQPDAPIDHQQTSSSSSSSSQLPLPNADYEVFLSFRGPDTRRQFTDFLFHFLDSLHIRTFIDDNDLSQGDEIAPSLIKSIEQSKIYIVILSEKYAESKWCLNELAKIVECRERDKRHIILPVFYLVQPTDVKNQTGLYQKAFQQLEEKFGSETVQKWKDALKVVGNISGWHVKSIDEHRTTIDGVSSSVLYHIRRNDNLIDDDGLVGIDDHVKAITEKLSLDSQGITMVGLHGFGGIGKTTIAKTVFRKLGDKFERQCFLKNIRQTQEDGDDGTISLQKKLISSVIMRKDFAVSISSVDEGRKLIQDRVSQFQVLIVLDDVDEKFNFKEVLGDLKNFDLGSRFIITSRNVKVLSSLNENKCKLYEVGPMNQKLSVQLFCKHAFEGNAPEPGFETLTKKFVEKIAGVPLVLKVVGSSLLKEKKPFWEDKLAGIKKIPHKEIIQTLKTSYEPLDYEAKQVFLDIACFYIGARKELASYMWSDLGFHPVTNIRTLIQRSLIKIGADGRFKMHDQLRDMGRAIVREENIEKPWMRSRVWEEKEAKELLQEKKGSENVKGLNVDDEYEDEELTREHFFKVPELRYFKGEGVAFNGDFSDILPDIRWLCLHWHNNKGYHLTNFNMKNLLILDLQDSQHLESDWGGWSQIKMANKLKCLNLYGCSSLTKLPDFPQSGSLEELDLSDVDHLDSGAELNVRYLCNLKELKLCNVNLKRIIGGTIVKMKRLEVLDITDLKCHNLEEVLVGIEELSSLMRLITIRPMTNDLLDIEELKASDIEEILEFEKKRGSKKEVLTLGKLPTSLKLLHTSSRVVNLSELLELQELVVEDCNFELQIPSAEDSWWKDSKLKRMVLIHTNIAVEEASYSQLPSSLHSLFFWDCLESEWLPTLENLENLTELDIIGCSYLREIQGLENLLQFNKLESLTISSCPLLTSTFHRGSHSSGTTVEALQKLCIRNCGGGISRLSNFPNLRELEIGQIIDEAPDQGMESRLEGIADMKELEILKLYQLESVERLPSFSKLQKLYILAIQDMPRLRDIQGLADLKSLERLVLAGCTALEGLKLPNLKLLEELDIRGCHNLPSSDLDALKANYPPSKNVHINWPEEPYPTSTDEDSSST